MTKLIVTTDLHQHPTKWGLLVAAVVEQKPDMVLIAGDILPKYGGFAKQREFFPELRDLLARVRDEAGSQVLLYLCNDDAHYLEPLVDELEGDGLCINMAQRVYRAGGLVYCGMNRVRDYPFGYKHYCVPDGDWVADPVQFCGEGITFDDNGEEVAIQNLRSYLLAKPSIEDHLEQLKGQLEPGEMVRSVWMVHQPPASLGMDLCGNGKLAGSPALLRFIRENQPLLGVSGHIHESPHRPGGQWMAAVGRTTWLQPGQVYDRLHYVTMEMDDEPVVSNIRHSIFGEPPSE
jgi:Icc-related predicted phosphoesterase